MKVAPPPGIRTDFPPLSAEPFWYKSENVRFRLGLPETVGLFARFIDTDTDTAVDALLTGVIGPTSAVDFYSDGDVLVIASGNTLAFIQWATSIVQVVTVAEVGATGRWWFDATETDIIAGRSNLLGSAIAIPRATLVPVAIPGAPVGSVAGGIYAGVLILAGTTSFGDADQRMTVRWSARRTDGSSSGLPAGPFGFEDWTPSDLNASGEIQLENGSAIKAAGTTLFGYMVWTDTALYKITARTDLYVFSEAQASSRGILDNKTWVVADDRLWWYDQTRTLNVYDGGRARQVVCPLSNATIEALSDADLERTSLSSNQEQGEVSLHYPGRDGRMRELVYNFREDVWYAFNLDRLNMTSANSPRASIGMDGDGRLFFYDLRELLPDLLIEPTFPSVSGERFRASDTPEPFSFFIGTNYLSAGDASTASLRSRNVVVSYTFAKGEFTPAIDDQLRLTTRSYGRLNLNETPTIDYQDVDIGDLLFFLRSGGKAVSYELSGVNVQTFLRFSVMDVEVDPGGKK